MFTFFLKKNICDGWDNLFTLILGNLFSVVLTFLGIFAFLTISAVQPLLGDLVLIVISGIFMIPVFAWGANARKIADFNTPSFATLFRTMAVVWKQAFAFGALLALAAIVVLVGFRYYLEMFLNGKLLGLLLAAILFWFSLICVLALQWFIPFYFLQEENNFIKCFKKSFIVFFDNPGFTCVVFVYNVFLFAFSVMLFFFVPGANGITLSCTNALRLRLYKYDWLEKQGADTTINSRGKRIVIPWNELLAADRETLGPRKLSSFLFPWK